MSRWFLFWPICLILVMVADMLSTYYSIPDLKNERNWFVSVLGFGWPAFLTVYFLLGLPEIILYLYHAKRIHYSVPFSQVISYYNLPKLYFKYIASSVFYTNYTSKVQRFANAIINGLGYFIIRLSVFGKIFATITNLIEGFFDRNYKFIEQDKYTYIIVGQNSPIKPFPYLENIVFNWVLYEDIVEVDWYPYLTLIAIVIVAFFFTRFEYHRMILSQQQPQTITNADYAALA